jgi:type IX secretion system PorP/SprF family membrane protein
LKQKRVRWRAVWPKKAQFFVSEATIQPVTKKKRKNLRLIMRNCYLSVLFVFLAISLSAQQLAQYSLYNMNPYVFNSAYAGMESTLVATGAYRQQWSGLKGAPVTQHVNAHLPIYSINSGIGLRVENDVIGAHNGSHAVLSYSYHLQVGRLSTLSVGLGAGYTQYVLDGAKLRAPQGSYENPDFSHNDQVLPEGKERVGAPMLEAGVFWQGKNLEIAVSVQPVYASKLTTGTGGFGIKPIQHGFFYTAYSHSLTDNLTLKPSILVKTDLIKTQAEATLLARWREMIFAGVGFRGFSSASKDAAVLIGGLKLNDKTILLYAFDVPLSALSSANRGSHELLLRYSLNRPIGVGKLPPVVYNPRFF